MQTSYMTTEAPLNTKIPDHDPFGSGFLANYNHQLSLSVEKSVVEENICSYILFFYSVVYVMIFALCFFPPKVAIHNILWRLF